MAGSLPFELTMLLDATLPPVSLKEVPAIARAAEAQGFAGPGVHGEIHPGPGHAGQGSYRAAIWHALAGFAGQETVGDDCCAARLLEHLADGCAIEPAR